MLTCFTPTRRLATYLSEEWVKKNIVSNKVVPKPFIFSLEDGLTLFFRQLEIEGKTDKILLSSAESLLILEDIIQHSPQGEGLLKLTTTAKLVWQAWQHFTLWECEFKDGDWEREDNLAFYHWITVYSDRLAKEGWTDKPQLASCLMKVISKDSHFPEVAPLKKIELYGFDDIPPLYQSFFHFLRTLGWEMIEVALDNQNATIETQSFPDVETEFKAVSHWAKQHLEQDQNARIGVIIPELPRYRYIVEKILQDTFHPDARLYPTPVVSEFYNMSAGQPLNTLPIIVLAMKCLGACAYKLPSRSYHEWAVFFCNYLKEQGWPGERILDSVEHQATSQWQHVLETFAKLDLLFEPPNFYKALIQLKHLLQDMPFQPQSKVVRLHVLGALEAAGQSFTHVWLTGLTDEDWPSLPSPNPFLPIQLQKTLNMPHATHERQLQFTESMTKRLLQAAPYITLSYPMSYQGRVLSPSAFLLASKETLANDINIEPPSIAKRLFDSQQIEMCLDDKAPPLEFDILPSPARTLRLQAYCPFRAFAEIRLKLPPPEKIELGLTLAERGILVHRLLDHIWAKLKSHAVLLKATEHDVCMLIEDAINSQIQDFQSPRVGKAFWETECLRLKTLMRAWLELEKSRSEFEVIAREAACPVEMNGLKFNIRIDRVDRDPEGRYFIIDYKTGRSDLKGLLSADFLEPQLPLYCFNGHFEAPSAVVFAQVRADECRFVGLSDAADWFPEVKSIESLAWEGLLVHWEGELIKLIQAFQEGIASVTPKEKSICQTCHVQSLCRIKEAVYAR